MKTLPFFFFLGGGKGRRSFRKYCESESFELSTWRKNRGYIIRITYNLINNLVYQKMKTSFLFQIALVFRAVIYIYDQLYFIIFRNESESFAYLSRRLKNHLKNQLDIIQPFLKQINCVAIVLKRLTVTKIYELIDMEIKLLLPAHYKNNCIHDY